MDVKFENKVKKELFCNIQVGECFVVDLFTPDEMICMRMYQPENSEDNAVELLSGEVYHFDDDEEVVPIKTELTVRLGG